MKTKHEPNKPNSLRLINALLAGVISLVATGCSVFGVESVEEAPYKSVKQSEPFEIRDYAPSVVAETRVDASFKDAGREAFGRLFKYISGENESAQTIAMTAPVSGEANNGSQTIEMTAPVSFETDGESWTYNFVLPQSFTIDTAPTPLNPDVVLAEIPEKRVATVRFRGLMTDKAKSKNAEALLDWVESQNLIPTSAPRWAGYNAPWTLPPFRRNEVLIDVAAP